MRDKRKASHAFCRRKAKQTLLKQTSFRDGIRPYMMVLPSIAVFLFCYIYPIFLSLIHILKDHGASAKMASVSRIMRSF